MSQHRVNDLQPSDSKPSDGHAKAQTNPPPTPQGSPQDELRKALEEILDEYRDAILEQYFGRKDTINKLEALIYDFREQ